jgi:hypothetical protein
MECPICYDVIIEGESTSTPCGHTFHVTCMTSWLERATTCPSCRTRVAAAPTNPVAEPPWRGWFEDRYQRMAERRAVIRANLESIAVRVAEVQAQLDAHVAHEAARKAKRSAAAKRGAATRAANKARAMTCM